MLGHESRDEVIHLPLPASNCHTDIVGEYKANVKRNQPLAISLSH